MWMMNSSMSSVVIMCYMKRGVGAKYIVGAYTSFKYQKSTYCS